MFTDGEVMKKKLYVIITLCNLHITSAHALTIFGYDVTSWATKAFSAMNNVLIKLATHTFYPFNDLSNPPLTQTKQHLIANFLSKYIQLKRGGKIDYECCPELQAMTKRVIELEAQEQAKGRYTFVHAYKWPHHFYREIYTDLWKIAHNEPLVPYIFTRFAQLPQTPWMAWENFLQSREQEKVRHKLVSQGASSLRTERSYQYNMLYMNYALFANKTLGENTADYIKYNRSIAWIYFDPKDLIQEFEFARYLTPTDITHTVSELAKLKTDHEQLSAYGGGILLSFTPELLRQTVYPSKPFGFKRTVKIVNKTGKVIITTDPKLILDTLRSAPETIQDSDDFLFVCILSSDLALIPNNGLDIYEFNAANQEALAQWRAKKDKLMQWIKNRIDQIKKESAMRRATAIGEHLAPQSQSDAQDQQTIKSKL